jgi:hypothetical protein
MDCRVKPGNDTRVIFDYSAASVCGLGDCFAQ